MNRYADLGQLDWTYDRFPSETEIENCVVDGKFSVVCPFAGLLLSHIDLFQDISGLGLKGWKWQSVSSSLFDQKQIAKFGGAFWTLSARHFVPAQWTQQVRTLRPDLW